MFDTGTGELLREIMISKALPPGSGLFNGRALAISPDGSRIFVTGDVYGGTETADGFVYWGGYLTVAYSPTGEFLWGARYDGGVPLDVAVAPDGGQVYVTGVTEIDRPGMNIHYVVATAAFEASTGQALWAERFDSFDKDGSAIGFQLAVAPAGDAVYVSVFEVAQQPTRYSSVTLAYRTATASAQSGSERRLWVHRDDHARFSIPAGVGVSADGTVLVAGTLMEDAPYWEARYAVTALTPGGSERWHRTTGASSANLDIVTAPMTVHEDRVYVTGQSLDWGLSVSLDGPGYTLNSAVFTAAYEVDDGEPAWGHTYKVDSDFYTMPWDLNVSTTAPDRTQVFVTAYAADCDPYRIQPTRCRTRHATIVNLAYVSCRSCPAQDDGSLSDVARYNSNGPVGHASIGSPTGIGLEFGPFVAAAHPSLGILQAAGRVDSGCVAVGDDGDPAYPLRCQSPNNQQLGVFAYRSSAGSASDFNAIGREETSMMTARRPARGGWDA